MAKASGKKLGVSSKDELQGAEQLPVAGQQDSEQLTCRCNQG